MWFWGTESESGSGSSEKREGEEKVIAAGMFLQSSIIYYWSHGFTLLSV